MDEKRHTPVSCLSEVLNVRAGDCEGTQVKFAESTTTAREDFGKATKHAMLIVDVINVAGSSGALHAARVAAEVSKDASIDTLVFVLPKP